MCVFVGYPSVFRRSFFFGFLSHSHKISESRPFLERFGGPTVTSRMVVKKTEWGKKELLGRWWPPSTLSGGRQGLGHERHDGRHRRHGARFQFRVQQFIPDADLEGAGFGSGVDGGRGRDGGELLLEGRKERDRLGLVPSATAVLDRDRRHFLECWFF